MLFMVPKKQVEMENGHHSEFMVPKKQVEMENGHHGEFMMTQMQVEIKKRSPWRVHSAQIQS